MFNEFDDKPEIIEEEIVDFPPYPESGIMADSVIAGEVIEEPLIEEEEEEILPPSPKRRLRSPHSISLASEDASSETSFVAGIFPFLFS